MANTVEALSKYLVNFESGEEQIVTLFQDIPSKWYLSARKNGMHQFPVTSNKIKIYVKKFMLEIEPTEKIKEIIQVPRHKW